MHLPAWPALLALAVPVAAAVPDDAGRSWQAGDHHVHSEWSVDWDHSVSPPRAVRGGDSPYTRTRNAQAALANGLSWMVHTDHGGPGHAIINRDHAWPALQAARQAVPSLVQFHGMEFDVPAAEHASLIIAPGPHEREQLYTLERDHGRSEPLPPAKRDEEAQMLAALAAMRALVPQPLMFVNHPSRTARGVGDWGDVTPRELRAWHDAAPRVLVGMEGAPGHQAAHEPRGLYRNAGAPTMGGFDQMTAQVGGVWDTLLAEGRRFWITATSDSHINRRDGGQDFDPGQYSKTHVWARHEAGDILDGLRLGRMFAVTGDLIASMDLRVAAAAEPARSATLGGTLSLRPGEAMRITLALRQPSAPNANGDRPRLDHVDVIIGSADANGAPVMQVRRFAASALQRGQGRYLLRWELPAPTRGGFVRVRGSNTGEADPLPDPLDEDPWQDLWFYSNPVFVEISG